MQIDPRALGYTLQAIVRVKPMPGQLHLVQDVIRRLPEFEECDKVTGDDCFICRLYLHSIEQLDEILSKVTERAETARPSSNRRRSRAGCRRWGEASALKRSALQPTLAQWAARCAQPRFHCSTASKKASISVTRSSGTSSGM